MKCACCLCLFSTHAGRIVRIKLSGPVGSAGWSTTVESNSGPNCDWLVSLEAKWEWAGLDEEFYAQIYFTIHKFEDLQPPSYCNSEQNINMLINWSSHQWRFWWWWWWWRSDGEPAHFLPDWQTHQNTDLCFIFVSFHWCWSSGM